MLRQHSNYQNSNFGPRPTVGAAKEESGTEALTNFQKQRHYLRPHSMLILDLITMLPKAPPLTQFMANGPEIAKRFLQHREHFRFLNKPITIKVGFHYTMSKGIPKIMQHGLLRSDITRFYGSGIYIAENPHAFSAYGDTGILVLYIPGTVLNLGQKEKTNSHEYTDSFRGNKLSDHKSSRKNQKAAKTTYFDEIIMQNKEQILPVFAFPRSAINNADHLHRFHKQVQELVDRTVNFVDDYDGSYNNSNTSSNSHWLPRKTAVPRIFPSYDDLRREHSLYKNFEKRLQKPTRFVFLHDGTVVERL